jgi:hypothetical protein
MLPAAVLIALLFALYVVLRRTILADHADLQDVGVLVIIGIAAVSLILMLPLSLYYKVISSMVVIDSLAIFGGGWFIYQKERVSPRLIVKPYDPKGENTLDKNEQGRFGFKVHAENNNVMGVEVYCDDILQYWVEPKPDGREEKKEITNLIRGRPEKYAVPFYPYILRIEDPKKTVAPAVGQPLILEVSIQDRESKKVVSREITVIIGHGGIVEQAVDFKDFKITSKVHFAAGEGLDEEKDYPRQVAITNIKFVEVKEPNEALWPAPDKPTYRYGWSADVVEVEPKKAWWQFW